MDQPILEARNVNKHFGTFHVLDDISLVIPAGSIYGLLGPNGAGKTTFIRILNQITAPDTGSVQFNGRDIKLGDTASIGYLPEERGLYRKMKVWEQAIYLCRLKGMSKAEATNSLKDWFTRLNMKSWADKRVDELSKGMQQRLQFVVSVAHGPELLILDEPFSGFDPVNTEELKKEILRLNEEGTTIIFSTHNMASVEELCSEITLINKGQNILSGKVDEIQRSYSKSIYGVSFKGSQVAFANALGHQFEIENLVEKGELSNALIKAHSSMSTKDLLGSLIQQVDIVSFSEKLPSMNDVFIDMVTPKSEVA